MIVRASNLTVGTKILYSPSGACQPGTVILKFDIGDVVLGFNCDHGFAWDPDRNHYLPTTITTILDKIKLAAETYDMNYVYIIADTSLVYVVHGEIGVTHVTSINCKRCNLSNPFAHANQPDGSYVCYECR